MVRTTLVPASQSPPPRGARERVGARAARAREQAHEPETCRKQGERGEDGAQECPARRDRLSVEVDHAYAGRHLAERLASEGGQRDNGREVEQREKGTQGQPRKTGRGGYRHAERAGGQGDDQTVDGPEQEQVRDTGRDSAAGPSRTRAGGMRGKRPPFDSAVRGEELRGRARGDALLMRPPPRYARRPAAHG